MTNPFRLDPRTLRPLEIGPLAPHLAGFAHLLAYRRYCRLTAWRKLRLVADLSRWMVQNKFRLKDLDEQGVAKFLAWHWRRFVYRSGDKCTFAALLQHLRQMDVVPPRTPPPLTPIDAVERAYGQYLRQERSFTSASVGLYVAVARRLLWHRFRDGRIRLKALGTKDVSDFVLKDSAIRGRRAAQLMTTVLRSFLNYLFEEGETATNLATTIPAAAGGRLSELPRYLEAAEVERLLRSCDRRRKVGLRDFAVLVLLARLGLRAGEVVHLELEDIDWGTGELAIRGKGNRVDRMPLLQEVGEAVADYLKRGRPWCSTRRVFVHCKAPYAGFSSPPNAVSAIVRRALGRAGLNPPNHGAHLLRHSLATNLLRAGASLTQVGHVLRHQQIQTTEIYAKVDVKALRSLAQPWPGGAQ
jgi:site-specific recombinase XerD